MFGGTRRGIDTDYDKDSDTSYSIWVNLCASVVPALCWVLGAEALRSDPMSPAPTAWTDDSLADPHAVQDKAQRVRQMFAAIAPSYDLNNRLHSLGRDQSWRRAAVRAADLRPGDEVLDVACGTGDLALAFARAGAGRIVGMDFTSDMLSVARRKRTRALTAVPGYVCGDALRLPVADACADVVSIAFGIRNVSDVSAALREFHRVLRPGGRVVVLEFSMPTRRPLRGLYQFYFQRVMPCTASLIARDRSGAYRYLPRSVDTFLDSRQMAEHLAAAGFQSTTMRPLTFGIAVIHSAIKP